jgi:hypothetical protein
MAASSLHCPVIPFIFMASQTPRPLQLGDRVRERSRTGNVVANPLSPSYKTVCEILSHRREGQVVGLEARKNSKGTRCDYAMVQWDHLKSPSVHAAFRLERVSAADD